MPIWAVILIAVWCFVAGLVLGIRLSLPHPIGTIIFNKTSPSKPLFELHFEQDPHDLIESTIVTLNFDIK